MMKQFGLSWMRMFSVLILGVLVIGTLSGCSKTGKADVGRYVEEEVALPDGFNRPLYSTYDKEGNFIYYVIQNEKVTRNVLSKSGDVDGKEVAWLGSVVANGGNIVGCSEKGDGTVYAISMDANGKSELLRSKDGANYEAVAVSELEASGESANGTDVDAGFEIKDEEGSGTNVKGEKKMTIGPKTQGGDNPDGQTQSQVIKNGTNGTITFQGGQFMPMGVYAVENGFLIDYGMEGVYQYEENGSYVRKYSATDEGAMGGVRMGGGGGSTAVYGNVLALANKDKGEIHLYDVSTGDLTETLTYEGFEDGTYIGVDENGVYVGDANGISQWVKGNLEQVVDGGLTSLIQPNLVINQLFRTSDGEYYALLGEMEDAKLFRYTYDENVPKDPDTVLEVFSLYDNNTIRLAIGEFQRSNPNVKVNLTIGMGEDGSATAEDVIRALNTELIAGKGPDILVLDGLPIDSYMEKDVLKDITALKDRLASEEGLLPNLTEAYAKDGKTYGLPSRFMMPVIMGDEGLVGSIRSLSELVDTVTSRQSKDEPILRAPDHLWGDDPNGNQFLMDYYEACVEDWMNEDGTVNEEKLAAYYQQMLTLDRLLKEINPETSGKRKGILSMGGGGSESVDFGANDLKDNKAKIHIQTLVGMGGFMNIVTNLSDMEGMDLTSLFGRNQYYPQGGVGIVSAGKQQELAEGFLELIMKETVQDKYLYDGFPVNGNSLKKLVEKMMDERNDANKGGIGSIESDMGFLDMCNGLTNAVLVDQVVKDKVQSQVEGLLAGGVTPEEAAAKVVDETKLYLME